MQEPQANQPIRTICTKQTASLIRRTSDKPIIAIDVDGVLCNSAAADIYMLNKYHNLKITEGDLVSNLLHKNRGWGSQAETRAKLLAFNKLGRLDQVRPVQHAIDMCQRIKDLGYALHVLTARTVDRSSLTLNWLKKAGFPEDMFDAYHFVSVFDPVERKCLSKPKFEMAKEIGAVLLIDDDPNQCIPCATQMPPIPALVFGDYAYQKRRWPEHDDGLAWDEREAAGIPLPPVEPGWFLQRNVDQAKTWKEVLDWVSTKGPLSPYNSREGTPGTPDTE